MLTPQRRKIFCGYFLGLALCDAIFWPGEKSENRLIDRDRLHSEAAAIAGKRFEFPNFSEQRLDIIAELIGFTVRPLCRSAHSPVRARS